MTTDVQGAAQLVINCVGLGKVYHQGDQPLPVLDNLSLAVRSGERIAIIGSSGSGKTTLLNLLGGLDDPDSGEVAVMGKPFAPMGESERARWRNQQLGFVYQFHHLLGEFSAQENVLMPLLIAAMPKAEAQQRASALLEQVGLQARLQHRPHELSGGERQRVAIARSLATNPACVLMDEPTGNLDPATSEKVLALLLSLNRELSTSFVIVTHDRDVAHQMDRVLELQNGQLVDVTGQV